MMAAEQDPKQRGEAPSRRPRIVPESNVPERLHFDVPEAWLPLLVMVGNRPSLAPGEWPADIYGGEHRAEPMHSHEFPAIGGYFA